MSSFQDYYLYGPNNLENPILKCRNANCRIELQFNLESRWASKFCTTQCESTSMRPRAPICWFCDKNAMKIPFDSTKADNPKYQQRKQKYAPSCINGDHIAWAISFGFTEPRNL